MDEEGKLIERIKREVVLLKGTQKFLEAHEQEINACEETFNTLGVEIDNARMKEYRKNRRERMREKRKEKLEMERLQSQQREISHTETNPEQELPAESGAEDIPNESAEIIKYYREVLAVHQLSLTEIEKWDQSYIEYYMESDTSLESSSSSESETDKSVVKYPLTQKMKAKQDFIQREQKAWKKSKMQKNIEKKLNELYMIKSKMSYDKYAFGCHKDVRCQNEKIHKDHIANILKKEFNIDMDKIHRQSDTVINKFRKYKQEKIDLEKKQVEHRIEILGRLLMEEKKKHKDYRIREVGKVIKFPSLLPSIDLPALEEMLAEELLQPVTDAEQHPEEEAIYLLSEQETMPEDESGIDSSWTDEKEDSKGKKDKKGKKEKKEKKEKSGKKGDKDKGKKGKKEGKEKTKKDNQSEKSKEKQKEKAVKGKKSKQIKEEPLETLKPPTPPPRRHHVEAENILLPELMNAFQWTEELQEDIQIIRAPPPSLVTSETYFIWKPNPVLFKNFRSGRIYRQHVLATNVSRLRVSCRQVGLELDDDLQLKAFEVDPYDTQDVCPGMSFEFIITFRPLASTNEVLGEVKFETWHSSESPQQNFTVPLHCCPKLPDYPHPHIRPLELHFPTVPGWSGRVCKTLKLINSGTMACFANIQKIDQEPELTAAEEVIDIVPYISEEEHAINEEEIHYSAIDDVESHVESFNKEKSKTKPKKSKMMKGDIKSSTLMSNNIITDDGKNMEEKFDLKLLEGIEDEVIITENVSYEQQIELLSEAELTASDILDECINNIFEVFCLDHKYFIRLEPKSFVPLKVRFGDYPYGTYQEKFVVRFEDDYHNCLSQVMVPFSGEIIPFPLTVEPVVIDLQTCLFDGGVYRSPFKVLNTSSLSIGLTVHVPPCMQNHVKVLPKKSYVHAKCSVSFSVVLAAKGSLCMDAAKYYSAEMQVLDFPLSVQPANPTLGHCQPLTIQVLAIVTSPHALVLTPAKCYLGTVTTLETVCKVLTLTNNSLTIQRYFFINVPDSVLIQPCGHGRILPGESRKLHLLYSPRPCDIEGNASLLNSGQDGEHRFSLKCTTVASHMGNGNRIRKLKQEHHYRDETFTEEQQKRDTKKITTEEQEDKDFLELNSDIFKPTHTSHTSNKIISDFQNYVNRDSKVAEYEDLVKPIDTIHNTLSENLELTADIKSECFIKVESVSELLIVEKMEHTSEFVDEISDISQNDSINSSLGEENEDVDKRVEKTVIHCEAYVIDPLCELSATRVLFPATPCGSYSLVSIRLETENKATEPDCRCGVLPAIGQRKKKFHVWFEFRSGHRAISVEPRRGHVLSGKSVKVTLVFQPFLLTHVVEQRARILKAEEMMIERRRIQMEEELAKNSKKGKSNKKMNTPKSEENPLDKESESREKKEGKEEKEKKKGKENKEKKEKKEGKEKTGSRKKDRGKKGDKVDNDIIDPLEEIINPDDMILEPKDLFPAEKSLLESLDPYTIETTVKCLVETAVSEEVGLPRRMEVHRLMVKCPVVRPDFLLRYTSQHLEFGTVATDTSTRCHFSVQNINTRSIPVSVSLLNPLGPFFCPSTTTQVAPEHILTLPVTFKPTIESQQINEYFEVRSGRTIIPLMTSGVGVIPQFDILPDFLVYRFQVKAGKEADFTIEVHNNCMAPLTFKMNKVFVKEAEDREPSRAESPHLTEEDDKKRPKSGKSDKKAKPKKEKKSKKLNAMDLELSPEENKALECYFKESEEDLSKLFTTVGLSETNEIIVTPFEKAFFKVKFTPPKSVNMIPKSKKEKNVKGKRKRDESSPEKGSNTSKKKKKKRDSSQLKGKKDDSGAEDVKMENFKGEGKEEVVDKPPMKYAAKYNLILGNILYVREYIFMASIQRQKEKSKGKGEKKKKDKKNKAKK